MGWYVVEVATKKDGGGDGAVNEHLPWVDNFEGTAWNGGKSAEVTAGAEEEDEDAEGCVLFPPFCFIFGPPGASCF